MLQYENHCTRNCVHSVLTSMSVFNKVYTEIDGDWLVAGLVLMLIIALNSVSRGDVFVDRL